MVDDFEESKQPRASVEDVDRRVETEMTSYVEATPFAVRLRMIILLSLICWAVVIAGVAWIAG